MRWAALLAVMAMQLGCTPRSSCDERALDGALSRFEADPGAEDAPRELVNAMSSACPAFPEELFFALGHTYVDPDDDELLRVLEDERYKQARRVACGGPQWGAAADLPGDERPKAVYELCNFERLGVLDVGEPFLYDDFPGMLSQHWMLDHHVDPALARRFNRSLMIATAPEPLSRRRCHAHPSSFSCETFMRHHGAGLPTLPQQLGFEEEPSASLFDTPTWIAVGDSIAITDTTTIRSAGGHLQASSSEADIDHLMLYVDRNSSWAKVLELMRLGHRSGYHTFSLMIAGVEAVDRLKLVPPASWNDDEKNEDQREEQAGLPVFVIEDPGVLLPRTGLGPLDGSAQRLLAETPHESLVVRAGADVGVQRVVSALDIIRGSKCRLEIDDCIAWTPIVDLDPPTRRRAGDWSKLRFGPLEAEAWPNRTGPVTLDQLQARVEQASEPLRACLVASEPASIYMPEKMLLSFGLDDLDELAVLVSGPWSDTLPSECIAFALDLPSLASSARIIDKIFASVELPIEVPE